MAYELFDKSPVRLFEKAVGGPLVAGELVLITSKRGLGKTAVLVQFGVDALLEGKGVVHVSFNQKSSNVITWYENIFTEIAKKKNIGTPAEILTELVRSRMILNVNQDVAAIPRTISTIQALAGSGGTKTSTLLIDDFDFSKVAAFDFQTLKKFAREDGVRVFLSTTSEAVTLDGILSNEIEPLFDTVLRLESKSDGIEMLPLKFRGNKNVVAKIKLDSKTLLITI